MIQRRRMRVLVLAEACNPDWPSVPLLGWRGTESLAQLVDVHLVTQVRNKTAIMERAPTWPCTFIDTEDLAGPLFKAGAILRRGTGRAWTLNSLIASISYPLFERRAWTLLGPRIRAGEFDVVHRLTPVSPGFASSFARKCTDAGVPFVLGPINGGVPWPPGFEAERAREGERLSALRGLHKHSPGYLATREHAATILVGSSVAMAELPQRFRCKAVLMPENAVYEREIFDGPRRFDDGPLRVVFVGRLVPLKGGSMLIEAFRRATSLAKDSITLDILGDGPERSRLEALAEGRSDIRFHGNVSRDRVLAVLRECHVLALPSIREFGGGVVLEAMACGAVPIVADHGGPRDLVGPTTGYRLAFDSRETLTTALMTQLVHCARNRDALGKMSAAAIQHVRTSLTWEARAQALLELYERLIDPDGPRSTRMDRTINPGDQRPAAA